MRLKNPKRKGIEFERRVRRYLQEYLGAFVVRQPCSAFPDIIAIFPDAIYFVECKVNGYIKASELKRLSDLAKEYWALPFIAYLNKDNNIVLQEVDYEEKDPTEREETRTAKA